MFVPGSAGQRASQLRQICLLPLPLPDRIIGERHVAFLRKVRGEQLHLGLSLLRVPDRHKNARIPARLTRPVSIPGDMEAGQAFEYHLLNDIAIALNAPRGPRAQRSPIRRKPSNQLEHLLPHHLPPPVRIPRRADLRNRLFALIQLNQCPAAEPLEQRISRRSLGAEGNEEAGDKRAERGEAEHATNDKTLSSRGSQNTPHLIDIMPPRLN